MSSMAERIKWLRKDKCHKTQEEVARHVGVQKAAIQKYENGIVTNIPLDKIKLLADCLETTPGFIMGLEEDKEYEKLDTRFGLALKRERERQKKSIREFANEIGISERMLAKYERGEIIPTASTAFLIAAQVGIPIDEYDPVYIRAKEKTESEMLNEEIMTSLNLLSTKNQKQVRDYIRFLAMQESNE